MLTSSRAAGSGLYMSAFEKGGPVSFDDEAAFCEHMTIHELPDASPSGAARCVRLETCHKNWVVACGDGSVCDSGSKLAAEAGDAADAQRTFDMEILGFHD